MRRLRSGELLAGLAAVALLVVMTVLDWFGGDDAWSAFTILDIWLAIVAAVALALCVAQARRPSPSIPVALSVVTTLVAGAGSIALVVRLIDGPGGAVRAGAWIGLACCLGVAAGGWRSMRQEGVAGAPSPAAHLMPRP